MDEPLAADGFGETSTFFLQLFRHPRGALQAIEHLPIFITPIGHRMPVGVEIFQHQVGVLKVLCVGCGR